MKQTSEQSDFSWAARKIATDRFLAAAEGLTADQMDDTLDELGLVLPRSRAGRTALAEAAMRSTLPSRGSNATPHEPFVQAIIDALRAAPRKVKS